MRRHHKAIGDSRQTMPRAARHWRRWEDDDQVGDGGVPAGAGGCATTGPRSAAPVEVKLIAFNDFHGNLEPPKSAIDAAAPRGRTRCGCRPAARPISPRPSARCARRNPNSLVVSAGDMIGASPLVSALFLDEPTIHAMNLIRVDYNAVGNHEFDKRPGRAAAHAERRMREAYGAPALRGRALPGRALQLPRRERRQDRTAPTLFPGLCDSAASARAGAGDGSASSE